MIGTDEVEFFGEPSTGVEIDELLNHADLALYGAKAEARGSYRYYEPE